jgi:hypothetical protein
MNVMTDKIEKTSTYTKPFVRKDGTLGTRTYTQKYIATDLTLQKERKLVIDKIKKATLPQLKKSNGGSISERGQLCTRMLVKYRN